MTEVLVVDDDPVLGELLQEILGEEGYHVHVVHDPYAGLAWIADHWPHVVLVDLYLPGMNGWTFIHRCREQACGRRLGAVLMSASGVRGGSDPEQVAFLSKPFDFVDLLATIEQVGAAAARLSSREGVGDPIMAGGRA
jgi:CheY-like chemotaxis protein